MFTSTGIIEIHRSGWIIIAVDDDLCRYYLSQFNRGHVMTDIQLMKPKWGGHITVVRGNEYEPFEINPQTESVLDNNNGKEISFEYSHETFGNGNHYWLNVKCDCVLDLREELDLNREMIFPLHLTFGVKRII